MQDAGLGHGVKQGVGGGAIGDLAAGQQEGDGAAERIRLPSGKATPPPVLTRISVALPLKAGIHLPKQVNDDVVIPYGWPSVPLMGINPDHEVAEPKLFGGEPDPF